MEASLIIPIFLFGFMCILYLLEILAIQMSVRSAMHEVCYEFGTSNLNSQVITDSQMEEKLLDVIDKEVLDNSIIADGSKGFDLSASQVNYSTGVVQLNVNYKVSLPVPYFIGLDLHYEEEALFKR